MTPDSQRAGDLEPRPVPHREPQYACLVQSEKSRPTNSACPTRNARRSRPRVGGSPVHGSRCGAGSWACMWKSHTELLGRGELQHITQELSWTHGSEESISTCAAQRARCAICSRVPARVAQHSGWTRTRPPLWWLEVVQLVWPGVEAAAAGRMRGVRTARRGGHEGVGRGLALFG
eukprot:SAG11_NODE_1004_length_6210_cov_14.226150_5_plen_176_part_00